MEKLPMCRICLAENVPMYVVVNKSLHELYEKLTDIPFVTEDSRPILACSFCCTKLKHCFRLMRKCLEAEELFAQMMNEDYEPNPSINPDRLEFCGGLVKTEIQIISIVDVDQTENIVVKEELPAVCERRDDVIEIKDFRIHDIKQENLESGDLNREGEVLFPPLYFEDDAPFLEVEIEVEKVEESKQMRQSGEAYRSTVAKKPKLATRGTKTEDVKAVKQKKNVLADSNIIHNTEIHTFQEPFRDSKPRIDIFNNNNNNFVKENNSRKRRNNDDLACNSFRKKEKSFSCNICQRCFSHKGHLTRHMLQHTGEKPYKCKDCNRSFTQLSNLKRHFLTHSDEKPYKCDLCQCSYIDKRDLTKHILLHSGEKPYKCEICRFCCNDKRELSKHIRKHTGQKSVCEICKQKFSFASDLRKHIRIHTGEKPYICDICHRGFNVKSNLTKHIVAHSEIQY